MIELDSSLLVLMTNQLKAASSRFAFVQARVSAESLVRDECALAIHEALKNKGYYILMEKNTNGKKVDLLIYPSQEDIEKKNHACLIELKMAWPRGHGECSGYVKHDLQALKGRKHAWSLVLYFAFSESLNWMPFAHRCADFEKGVREFIARVDAGDPLLGPIFAFAHDGVRGKAQLMAWQAQVPA